MTTTKLDPATQADMARFLELESAILLKAEADELEEISQRQKLPLTWRHYDLQSGEWAAGRHGE